MMNKNLFALFIGIHALSISNAQIPADSAIRSQRDSPIEQNDSILNNPENIPKSLSLPNEPADIANFRSFKVNENNHCIYHVKPVIDIPITIVGILGTGTGFYLLNKKFPTDPNVILNLDPQTDIKVGFNRAAIHNYDPQASYISNNFLYGGFVYGFVLLLDHDIRQDAAKIGLLYLQTMAITGASYSLTAAFVNKLRPYAYNTDSVIVNDEKVPEVSLSTKTSNHARDSFYGGHPSVPAASTLFVASVFAAYHPNSPLRFVFYGVAVVSTATTVYLRYKGGDHFPTDLMVGVTLGSAYGLLVPYFHRCTNSTRLTFTPLTGRVKGADLTYSF